MGGSASSAMPANGALSDGAITTCFSQREMREAHSNVRACGVGAAASEFHISGGFYCRQVCNCQANWALALQVVDAMPSQPCTQAAHLASLRCAESGYPWTSQVSTVFTKGPRTCHSNQSFHSIPLCGEGRHTPAGGGDRAGWQGALRGDAAAHEQGHRRDVLAGQAEATFWGWAPHNAAAVGG